MAYQSEIEKLEQRYRENPDQWFAALADSYRKAGSLELALDVVQAGLAKRPNYVSGHIVLGRCLLQKPDDGAAAKAFEKVLSLDAENVIALKALSEVSERAGRMEDAVRWLSRLLEVDPMNDEAEQALARLKQAVAAAPPPAAPAADAADATGGVHAEEAGDVGPVAGFEATASEASADAEPEPVPEFSIEKSHEATAPEAGVVALEPLELESASVPVAYVEPAAPAPAAHAARAEPPAAPAHAEEDVGFEPVEFTPPPPAEVVEAAEGVENMEFQPPSASEVPPNAPDLEPMEFIPPAVSPSDVEAALRAHEPTLEPPIEPVDQPSSRGGDLPLFYPDDEPVPAGTVAREADAPAGAEPEPVVTETMAELYAKQGLMAEARDIYRKLAADRPGDAAVAGRLRELERAVSGRRPSGAARGVDGGPSARDFLAGVFGGSASVETALAEASPAGPAFGVDPGGSPAPTRRASDEVSLAQVFGEEPSPARPQASPAQPQAKSSGQGFSFDEFFGGQRKPAASGADQAPEDDDFKRWLKGLKS
jgi:tetratricopeptide (TPR) repeat protein